MAKAVLVALYDTIRAGKRVATIAACDLPAVKVWLWSNGYKYKANRMGDHIEIMIDEK